MTSSSTHIFKSVGACDIRADVYTRLDARPRPVIVWLHGGALIFGSRRMLPVAQVERYLDAGYTVVAADYRLAPETRLSQILTDVQDAIAWVRDEGSRLFGTDSQRLAVAGHSAGGYLALLAGRHVRPRPRALVAFYGYGEIVGPWYSTPSPFYCQQPLVREAEARSVVGIAPISEPPRTEAASGQAAPDRGRFYLYCRQQGRWPQEVTGFDPRHDATALSPFCPVHHITADYPPTLLLHGDRDSDVPHEQSVMMARALTDAQVPHRLLTIPGGEHGFDARADDPIVAAAFLETMEFLAQHL
ncbi:MAG: alpha/beta hydrolase [Thermomicrobiales bacterium]